MCQRLTSTAARFLQDSVGGELAAEMGEVVEPSGALSASSPWPPDSAARKRTESHFLNVEDGIDLSMQQILTSAIGLDHLLLSNLRISSSSSSVLQSYMVLDASSQEVLQQFGSQINFSQRTK
ncbi:uncharacterized protein [Lolium perenne]|uniref:uncharacterized protein n=1 Tax=Lolium perenne TaxID=4522 RepID=UPI003A9A50C0